MRQRHPDVRWQEVLQAIKSETPPTDAVALLAYDAHTKQLDDDPHAYACDLAFNQDDKDILVAFFLSGATTDEISKSLGIPESVLIIFQKLVIDPSVFRNKLEMLRYARDYRQRATEQGAKLIELGMSQGPFGLMYHFLHGHEELPVDTKAYARSMMQQAFYFGLMSRGNNIRSSVSKESLRWLAATSNLMKDYDRMLGDSHDSSEALLEIEKRKMTYTPDELGVNVEDFLH